MTILFKMVEDRRGEKVGRRKEQDSGRLLQSRVQKYGIEGGDR